MDRLKFVEESYKNKGFRVDFHNFAVSDRDNDIVTIFSETNSDLDVGAAYQQSCIQTTEYKETKPMNHRRRPPLPVDSADSPGTSGNLHLGLDKLPEQQ
ncbi:hypothetical protein MAR_014225 [Mya arenaria]|uniref:Uncharacterized protein n=1 Tax=Mya arenaria TaxID=6604 RepID=A0ABY7G632_MYAAR|nr:hypothetical protein MAR_014225 [Mya arenaria]